MDFNEALAEFITDPASTLPNRLSELPGRAILDTVGVTIAASAEESVRIASETVSSDNSGSSTAFVSGLKLDPQRAAWVNGVGAHALDFDDVDDQILGHPSAVLVPAVLAIGELVKSKGEEVADAYWIGLTTMRSVAAGVGIFEHYSKGWHSTSTLGGFGATAAACRLMRLGKSEVQSALGIAASLACGTRENFGSMTKPLHAGTAASSGILAASLAGQGFSANPYSLSGPMGFFALYSADDQYDESPSVQRAYSVLADPPEVGVNVKRHPSCYATHAAADAALALVGRGVTEAGIAEVSVSVPRGGLRPLIQRTAHSGLEGKFSLQYVIAAALLDGHLGLETFTDDAVNRTNVKELASRIAIDDDLSNDDSVGKGGLEFRASVSVRTDNGTEASEYCDAPVGHISRPLDVEELRKKADNCAHFGRVNLPEEFQTELLSLRSVDRITDLITVLDRDAVHASNAAS